MIGRATVVFALFRLTSGSILAHGGTHDTNLYVERCRQKDH